MWDLRLSKLFQKSSREISWVILVVFFVFNSGRVIDGQQLTFKYQDIPLCEKVPSYLDQFEMKIEEIRIDSLLFSSANMDGMSTVLGAKRCCIHRQVRHGSSLPLRS